MGRTLGCVGERVSNTEGEMKPWEVGCSIVVVESWGEGSGVNRDISAQIDTGVAGDVNCGMLLFVLLAPVPGGVWRENFGENNGDR